MSDDKYYVYILKSEKDDGYYIGCTSLSPKRRLKQHNSGYVRSTKTRMPFRLIYTESYTNKTEAFKREWFLKHPVGYLEKLNIIRKFLGQ